MKLAMKNHIVCSQSLRGSRINCTHHLSANMTALKSRQSKHQQSDCSNKVTTSLNSCNKRKTQRPLTIQLISGPVVYLMIMMTSSVTCASTSDKTQNSISGLSDSSIVIPNLRPGEKLFNNFYDFESPDDVSINANGDPFSVYNSNGLGNGQSLGANDGTTTLDNRLHLTDNRPASGLLLAPGLPVGAHFYGDKQQRQRQAEEMAQIILRYLLLVNTDGYKELRRRLNIDDLHLTPEETKLIAASLSKAATIASDANANEDTNNGDRVSTPISRFVSPYMKMLDSSENILKDSSYFQRQSTPNNLSDAIVVNNREMHVSQRTGANSGPMLLDALNDKILHSNKRHPGAKSLYSYLFKLKPAIESKGIPLESRDWTAGQPGIQSMTGPLGRTSNSIQTRSFTGTIAGTADAMGKRLENTRWNKLRGMWGKRSVSTSATEASINKERSSIDSSVDGEPRRNQSNDESPFFH